jgi:hypothetical protein
MKKLFAIPVLLLLFAACVTDPKDNYTAYHGSAKIVSIETSAYNPTGKHEYVDIYFDFIPDDPQAPEQYRYKTELDKNQRLFYDHRGNLHKNWVEDTGIRVDNVYPAVRYERTRHIFGAPVFFEVDVTPE